MSAQQHPAAALDFFNTFTNSTTTTFMSQDGVNSTTNTSSSISATSFISTSPSTRKQPPPQLEAIQTHKAQSSVTFQPISTTFPASALALLASKVDHATMDGDSQTLYSLYPSHSNATQQQQHPYLYHHQYHMFEEEANENLKAGEPLTNATIEPPLMTATTFNDNSIPFTPSTLVGGVVPSPMEAAYTNAHQRPILEDEGPMEIIPLSPGFDLKQKQVQLRSSTSLSRSLQQPQQQQQRREHQHQQSLSNIHIRHSVSNTSPLYRTSMSSTHNPPTHPRHLNSSAGTGTGISTGQYHSHHQASAFRSGLGSQGMDLTYSSSSDDPRFQYLPTLWQVLHRKTLPPVCLFNFYLYMRDTEQSSEEVDFWLDVTAHEVLWRLYVRATKRRMAVAEKERAMEREQERERMEEEEEERREREREERMNEVEDENQQEQNEEGQEAEEQAKKGHATKPSFTLDMYEPHWSAANRYLELSETSPDNPSHANQEDYEEQLEEKVDPIDHGYHDIEALQISEAIPSSSTTHRTHFNDTSEPVLLLQEASPMSPFSPTSPAVMMTAHTVTIRRAVPHLPGAVPSNWTHPREESHPTKQGTTGFSSLTASAAAIRNGSTQGAGPRRGSAVSAMNQRSGIKSKRAILSGTSGVTKEDLQRSAERIYYKYLIPQAESPVRIPGAVRRRVAMLMDSKMMGEGPGATVVGEVGSETGTGVGAGTDVAADLAMSSNEQAHDSTVAPSSRPAGLMVSAPLPGHDMKEISPTPRRKANISNATAQNLTSTQRNSAISNASLTQPDQDLGLVFAEAREIVFEGMESYYFPRFLKAKAFGNMVRWHRIFRAVGGLFVLFIGFVIVLCMIFLDLRPTSVRAWALIPIFIGIFLCTTFQFNICPIMAAVGVSETRWMQFAKIKEPYILILHRRRAVKVVVVAILYTVCVGILFGLLPGYRL